MTRCSGWIGMNDIRYCRQLATEPVLLLLPEDRSQDSGPVFSSGCCALYPVPVGTVGEFPVTGALVGDDVDTDSDTTTGSVCVVCGQHLGHVFGINIHGIFSSKFFLGNSSAIRTPSPPALTPSPSACIVTYPTETVTEKIFIFRINSVYKKF